MFFSPVWICSSRMVFRPWFFHLPVQCIKTSELLLDGEVVLLLLVEHVEKQHLLSLCHRGLLDFHTLPWQLPRWLVCLKSHLLLQKRGVREHMLKLRLQFLAVIALTKLLLQTTNWKSHPQNHNSSVFCCKKQKHLEAFCCFMLGLGWGFFSVLQHRSVMLLDSIGY